MNRAVLAIINQAEQTNRIQELIRSAIREELGTWKGISFQPAPMEPVYEDGMDDTIMDFRDNFT